MNPKDWLMPLTFIANAVTNVVGIVTREASAKKSDAIVKAKQELDVTMVQRQCDNQQKLEQQRAETSIKLALIQAKNQQELQEKSFEFQTWLKQQEWAETRALTEYVQQIQLKIANNSLDFQKWKVAEETELALTLKRLDGEITLRRGAMDRETQLILMNERYEKDHNPLWLTRRQFLSDAEIESLRIFLSPISPDLMGKLPGIKNNVETKLTKIAEYYSSQGRALRFFGDAWTNVKDAQEATAQAVFADYKSQPILILNAQMEGEYFYLKYNFWGSNWQTFRSGVLVDQLSLKEQQYLYAKREVQKWQKLRQESNNPDKIDLLYGTNNIQRLSTNLAIMEAETEATELGLDTDHFHYNLSEKEVRQSADYLVLLHCLNAGLWADIYFLLYAPTTQPLPPLLLNCLQDLDLINPKDYSKEEIADLIANLAKSYNEILQILTSRGQGVLIADLHLQMSESCFKLKLYELAKEQIILSVSNWLIHRNVNSDGDLLALLQLMKPYITSGDRHYITALQEMLHKLGVNSYLDDILPFLNLLAEQDEKRQREEAEAKRQAEEAKKQRELEAKKQRELEAKKQRELEAKKQRELRRQEEENRKLAEVEEARKLAEAKAKQRELEAKKQRELEEAKHKADFTTLAQYLADKKWKEADEKTTNVMLKIMGRESNSYLTEDDCKNFPPEELKIIDQLWVKYSNGKFGFSVQKQIWIKCGGKVGVYDSYIYIKFADEIGWRKGGNQLNYSQLNFTTNAPQAHLPVGVGLVPVVIGGRWWDYDMAGLEGRRWVFFSFLFSKL